MTKQRERVAAVEEEKKKPTGGKGTFFGRKQRNERRHLEPKKRVERPFWNEKRA